MTMQDYLDILKTAMNTGAVDMALETLVEIAEALIDADDKERAAEILALVLCYPLDDETLEIAEYLFLELESELCPRVMDDARRRAKDVTLQDEADHLLAATGL